MTASNNKPTEKSSADKIMQHDHEQTTRAQDRERQTNKDAFDSRADDDYSTGHNTSEYSASDNQSRFSGDADYPDGNMQRFEDQNNEANFGRNNVSNISGQAYDRSADYVREREEDQPFINDNRDKFYGRRETVDGEGKPSEEFASDHGQRYFTGDMGYHTKHAQDEEINGKVNQKSGQPTETAASSKASKAS